jgi:poly-gamma-glutamate capsule biosynthesis protein CapA/YwtB (metallophosphatase superfamily)
MKRMTEGLSRYQSEINQDNTVILQVVGDISLNGLFCDPQYQVDLTRNMKELSERLGVADLRIGNWESPLWGDGGVNNLKSPRIATTLDAAKCILPFRLDVALMASNHIYDCLEKGFENTVRFFEENNIKHLGAGTSESEARKPLILTRNGMKLGLLNYAGSETNPSIPSDAGVFLNMIDEDRLLTEVSDLKNHVDIVLVNLHCGTEFVRYPRLEQRHFTRRIVEAGAKVVSCHHSHCLQGHESWKEGHIFHSLGNFLFGGMAGRECQPWPKLSRLTAVSICVVSKDKVEQAYMKYLRQDGHILRWDETPMREMKQNRLNRNLKLSDAKYKRLFRKELLLQWGVHAPLRFISASGGVIKALRKLRWDHVVAAFNILTKKA